MYPAFGLVRTFHALRQSAQTAVCRRAPFYLLNGAVLLQDVKAGKPVTLNDVDLSGLETYRLYAEGLKL